MTTSMWITTSFGPSCPLTYRRSLPRPGNGAVAPVNRPRGLSGWKHSSKGWGRVNGAGIRRRRAAEAGDRAKADEGRGGFLGKSRCPRRCALILALAPALGPSSQLAVSVISVDESVRRAA